MQIYFGSCRTQAPPRSGAPLRVVEGGGGPSHTSVLKPDDDRFDFSGRRGDAGDATVLDPDVDDFLTARAVEGKDQRTADLGDCFTSGGEEQLLPEDPDANTNEDRRDHPLLTSGGDYLLA